MPKKKKEEYPQPSVAEVSASIWKRIGAFLIDMVIIYAIVFLALGDKILPPIDEATSMVEAFAALTDSSGIGDGVSFIVSTLVIVYYMMLEGKFSQSLGKMVMSIYVVPSSPDNQRISRFRHLGRCMFLIPIFGIADCIAVFFTKENQRLSEMLTKTKVIERKEIVPMENVVV